jgi:hypothetical protein
MLGGESRPMNSISQNTARLVALAGPVLATLLCFAAGAVADDSKRPTQRERIEDEAAIRGLLEDHTLYGRYVDGTPWMEYHSPDGRTAYHEHDCTYQGHWWTQYGLVCFRYDAFNNGVPSCFRLFRKGNELDFDQEYGADDWRLNAYTVDRKAGNPEKLPIEGQACVGV